MQRYTIRIGRQFLEEVLSSFFFYSLLSLFLSLSWFPLTCLVHSSVDGGNLLPSRVSTIYWKSWTEEEREREHQSSQFAPSASLSRWSGTGIGSKVQSRLLSHFDWYFVPRMLLSVPFSLYLSIYLSINIYIYICPIPSLIPSRPTASRIDFYDPTFILPAGATRLRSISIKLITNYRLRRPDRRTGATFN